MDPDVTLRHAREAFADNDFEESAMYYRELDEWMTRGGHRPKAWTQPTDS
jgi:hypothetical protein